MCFYLNEEKNSPILLNKHDFSRKIISVLKVNKHRIKKC